MLLIASDIHLGDGTCARSISPHAFSLFAKRLRELAYQASFSRDGSYKPIENIDLILMGDILDPLHSTQWLEGAIRPWSDPSDPLFAQTLRQITRSILKENSTALEEFRSISSGEAVRLPMPVSGHPDLKSQESIAPRVNIHYQVGNHDWYYRLPGADFDEIRREIISAMGLCNPANNFPWEAAESEPLQQVYEQYQVYGHHGDKFDRFNYNRDMGRNAATMGDVFTLEVVNRYPVAVMQELGNKLPPGMLESLQQLTNVRPALAAPLWITSRIRQYAGSDALMRKLKKIWDRVTTDFLQVNFVRESDKAFTFDLVDAMELVIKVTRKTSFQTINDIVIWMREKMWEDGVSLTDHALREPRFLNKSARYIAYGHTHNHKVIPLDTDGAHPEEQSQFYLNSGTWHSYYDLAVRIPEAHKFVQYQSMTYLTFFGKDECGTRNFEAWSGALG